MKIEIVTNALGIICAFNLFLLLVFSPFLSFAVGSSGFWEKVEENLFGSLSDMFGSAFCIVLGVICYLIHIDVLVLNL